MQAAEGKIQQSLIIPEIGKDETMASSIHYKDYILEQLSGLVSISCRPMMGEYLLYYQGTLFGGIYDDRLLVKKTAGNEKYSLAESIPYDGAKAMYLVSDVDDRKKLEKIVLDTYTRLLKR